MISPRRVVPAGLAGRRCCVALSFIVAAFVVSSTFTVGRSAGQTSFAYVPHEWIVIEVDSEFTGSNGVTQGTGTSDDPYVIENWEAPITVRNTTSHLLIRNMLIIGEQVNLWYAGGLELKNVTNCTVERCWKQAPPFEDFTWFRVQYCSDIKILMNRIETDVDISNSNRVTFQGNAVVYNGIMVKSSSEVVVKDNRIIDPSMLHDPGLGIVASSSHDVLIENNYLLRRTAHLLPSRGISLDSSTGVLVDHNFILSFHVLAVDDRGAENAWNMAYPIGGNYWTNYTGADMFSGPDQDMPGPDGFGDAPLVIDDNSSDSYPIYLEAAPNCPPFAFFSVWPSSGDATTLFWFEAYGSVDPENGTGIEARWSWDGGEGWTPWGSDLEAQNMFTTPGWQDVRLEVRDGLGATNSSSMSIYVSEAIPEFESVLVPVVAMLLVAAMMTAARRRT